MRGRLRVGRTAEGCCLPPTLVLLCYARLQPHHLKLFFSNKYIYGQIVRMADGHIVAAARCVQPGQAAGPFTHVLALPCLGCMAWLARPWCLGLGGHVMQCLKLAVGLLPLSPHSQCPAILPAAPLSRPCGKGWQQKALRHHALQQPAGWARFWRSARSRQGWPVCIGSGHMGSSTTASERRSLKRCAQPACR